MSKTTTMSRRSRRSQLRAMGYLKIKNMYSPLTGPGKAWYDRTRTDGNNAHEANVNRTQDSIESQLQEKLNSLKETWKGIGYNDAEIKMLEEAWLNVTVKNKATYREDKKAAHKLYKEARKSLNDRLNANS